MIDGTDAPVTGDKVWVPQPDNRYDWSMMRQVASGRDPFDPKVMTVGPNHQRPKPDGDDWKSCGRCGGEGWDADWGGPFRCERCEGVGWVKVEAA